MTPWWPLRPGRERRWPGFSSPLTPSTMPMPPALTCRQTKVVYVSPLKALAVDIQQNLDRPLKRSPCWRRRWGSKSRPSPSGCAPVTRPLSARAAMAKVPPTILVTTPESLYLLVTAQRSRAVAGTVETVIVDEIHALARDKRGSHLRHHARTARAPSWRDGRSALGCRPPNAPSRRPPSFSSARGTGRDATIVDCGHRRDLRSVGRASDTELAAVASTEQFGEIFDAIAGARRETTARRSSSSTRGGCPNAWRTCWASGSAPSSGRPSRHTVGAAPPRTETGCGPATCGRSSLPRRSSSDRHRPGGARRARWARLGPSPPSCSASDARTAASQVCPEGVLFPMTRDELVECAALLAAVHAGRLDAPATPSPRSTSWRSRLWPRWPQPRSGRRTTCSTRCAGPPPLRLDARRLRRRRHPRVRWHHHRPGKTHGAISTATA